MPYLHLFANCCLVKGPIRSIICDLQTQSYDYIPNGLHHIFQISEKKEISTIIDMI